MRRFVAKYNAESPDEWPAVKELSNGRLQKIQEYLTQFPREEFWTRVYEQAKKSKFCRSYQNADLDWLLQKGKNSHVENCVRVSEGKYE